MYESYKSANKTTVYKEQINYFFRPASCNTVIFYATGAFQKTYL